MYVAIWLFAAPACVYFIVRVLLVAARNHKAHKFFAERAPELPLVPGGRPNIFSGHITRVIVRKDNIQTIARLHEQLGPTFGFYRAEQPWVLTKDLDLLKLIELDEPHKHINRAQYGLPFREFRSCIFEARDDAWRRVRRAIAPALTNRMVRSEDTTGDIQSVLEQLAAAIRARLTSDRSMILNAGDMFQRYTLAVIFLLTYRRERIIDFHAARDDWVARMDWAARRIKNPFAAASVMFPFTRPLIERLVKLHPVGRMNAQITDYVKGAADLNREARVRMQKTPPRGQADTTRAAYKRRLVDSIIDALFEKRIQYDEFIGNGQFLLLAGFQTTADTITCLVWQLARHAAIQEQLRASLRNEGLESELLDWCVRETIRFHPAVPLGHGRVLGEDVQVNDGLRLPKGTFVMPSTHAIHHDAKIWPDPEAFKPERWRHAAEFHPAAFMGFGLGPRNCVGAKLAVHEIKLAIKLLLANYRIEKCRDTPDQYNFSAPGMIFTLLNVPIKVRLVELDVKKVNLE